MIGDHQGDPHGQFTALHPPEQILKTVALPARKNRHPRQLIREMQLSLSIQTFRQSSRRLRKCLTGDAETIEHPLNPAEEQTCTGIRVMVGMTDVSSVSGHPPGQLADQPWTIRTDQLKDDRRLAHDYRLKSKFSRAETAG